MATRGLVQVVDPAWRQTERQQQHARLMGPRMRPQSGCSKARNITVVVFSLIDFMFVAQFGLGAWHLDVSEVIGGVPFGWTLCQAALGFMLGGTVLGGLWLRKNLPWAYAGWTSANFMAAALSQVACWILLCGTAERLPGLVFASSITVLWLWTSYIGAYFRDE